MFARVVLKDGQILARGRWTVFLGPTNAGQRMLGRIPGVHPVKPGQVVEFPEGRGVVDATSWHVGPHHALVVCYVRGVAE